MPRLPCKSYPITLYVYVVSGVSLLRLTPSFVLDLAAVLHVPSEFLDSTMKYDISSSLTSLQESVAVVPETLTHCTF